ncbi:MAG: alpha/beta hydrolase [Spirochaetales bacterium]|nr:alpha/beta hydrolase [Spirochaetales bacterium]
MKTIKFTFILAVLLMGLVFLVSAQVNGVKIEKVEFKSQGTKIVGNLFIPETYIMGDRLPGIVLVGPATSVKEQVGGTYALELAERGFITLAFDHRGYGESDGDLRYGEDIFLKSEDIRSAVSFIRSLEQVDKDNIGAVGICGGAAALVQISAGERRINAVATVSGTLSLKAIIEASGGEVILSIASDAKQKYDQTGEPTYMRLFPEERPEISDRNPKQSKFNQEAWDFYVANEDDYPDWSPNIDLAAFCNQAAFDIPSAVSSISPTPVLYIAGTEAVTAPMSQNAYDNSNEPRKLYWIDEATHIGMYYVEEYIDEAADELARFFTEKLKRNEL